MTEAFVEVDPADYSKHNTEDQDNEGQTLHYSLYQRKIRNNVKKFGAP
jgi:hypothetical protein